MQIERRQTFTQRISGIHTIKYDKQIFRTENVNNLILVLPKKKCSNECSF